MFIIYKVWKFQSDWIDIHRVISNFLGCPLFEAELPGSLVHLSLIQADITSRAGRTGTLWTSKTIQRGRLWTLYTSNHQVRRSHLNENADDMMHDKMQSLLQITHSEFVSMVLNANTTQNGVAPVEKFPKQEKVNWFMLCTWCMFILWLMYFVYRGSFK